MKPVLPVGLVLIGVVLLLLSAVWPSLFPATNNWTNEKSERLAELGSQTNLLKFQLVEAQNNPQMHAGRNPAELKEQYEQARADYDQLHAEFESARDAPEGLAQSLRGTGIALALIGGLAMFVSRGD